MRMRHLAPVKPDSHCIKKIVLLSLLLICFTRIFSQIPANIKTQLTANLNTLSVGWDEDAKNSANAIFDTYSTQPVTEWTSFFNTYFSSNLFTADLANYLGYPTFSWLSNQLHINLQSSLNSTFQNKIADYLANGGTGNWQSSLQNMMRFLGDFFINDLSNTIMLHSSIADFCLALTNTYPAIFKKPSFVILASGVYKANIRAQLYGILASYNYYNKNKTALIASTLNLAGTNSPYQLKIWNEFGILIADNGTGDYNNTRFEKTYTLLQNTPQNMHRVVLITEDQATSGFSVSMVSGFNTFAGVVGQLQENGFPPDVPGYPSDLMMVVLAHELSHNLDSYGLNVTKPFLGAYRDALIAAAGNDSLNYLRSMLDNGFFTSTPQEFVASIGNQYYANTALTFQLARTRFASGRTQPINQFLLFANLMSGTDSTVFFKIDAKANFTITRLKLERNSSGFITKLFTGPNCFYEFTLDNKNMVTNIIPPLVPCSAEVLALTGLEDFMVKGNCNASLYWSGAETTFNHFEVQYSEDGVAFKTIANLTVAAAAFGKNYKYADIQRQGSSAYYRIKAVETNGKLAYSPVRKLSLNCNTASISISPNPTAGQIQVYGLKGTETLQVYTAAGQLLQQKHATPGTNYIDLKSFPDGYYNIIVIGGIDGVVTTKVVKKKG